MKFSFFFALLLIFGTACEIDDDFGKLTVPDSPGERVASSAEYTTRMIWYQKDKVLLHHGSLSVLDLDGGSIGKVSEEYFHDVAGVTDSGMAIGVVIQNEGTLGLRAIDLEGSDYITLSTNVHTNYNTGTFAVIAGNDVFYAEIDADMRQFINRHNVITNQKSALMEDGVPLAISPDGTQLLYINSAQQYMVYSLAEGTHSPLGFLSDLPLRIVWNNLGIIGYFYIIGQNGGVLQIRNLETGSLIIEQYGVVDALSIFVSHDGQQYTYSTTRCSNPYYVYNCYDQPTLIGIIQGALSGGAVRELARHLANAEIAVESVGAGAFAPDASAFIYSLADEIYSVSLTE